MAEAASAQPCVARGSQPPFSLIPEPLAPSPSSSAVALFLVELAGPAQEVALLIGEAGFSVGLDLFQDCVDFDVEVWLPLPLALARVFRLALRPRVVKTDP